MTTLVQYCRSQDLTPAGECLSPFWAEPPSLLPPLPVDDAMLLLGSFLALHALVFGARMVVQFLLSSGANRF